MFHRSQRSNRRQKERSPNTTSIPRISFLYPVGKAVKLIFENFFIKSNES
jgi:hypothetical protein